MKRIGMTLVLVVGLAPPLAAQERRAVRQNADDEAKAEVVLAPAKSLGVVSLDNGNAIEFLEPEAGVVFVVETGQYPQVPVLPRLSLGSEATPADVYRAVAPGRAVPRSIRRARLVTAEEEEEEISEEERLREVSEEGETLALTAVPAAPVLQPIPVEPRPQAPPPPKPGEQKPADPPKPPEDATRAAWFQAKFCGGKAAVTWCWVDRSGVSTKEAWGIGIAAVAFSCSGTTRFQVQYRRLGKWKSYGSYDVLPGYYRIVSRWGVPRTRRSRVEGTCFHHAGEGVR